jgi:hypothetical protein
MHDEKHQILSDINKKLEELLLLKHDFAELNERTRNIEEILSEYMLVLNEEEKSDLDEAMREYTKGKTIPLEDARRILKL